MRKLKRGETLSTRQTLYNIIKYNLPFILPKVFTFKINASTLLLGTNRGSQKEVIFKTFLTLL